MNVRFTTDRTVCTNSGSYLPGSVHDLEDSAALEMVEGGFAEFTDENFEIDVGDSAPKPSGAVLTYGNAR